jgi:hypothetical protein
MRILLIPGILSTLLFYSCQKEVDFANGVNGVNNAKNHLLQKVVSKSGSDSSNLIFAYNSSEQLIQLTTIDVTGGVKTMTSERAERNSQGIIQKLFIKDDEYQRLGLDSVVTIVQYSGGKYLSKVTTIDVGIAIFRDSVAIMYDPSGKVITEIMYDDFAVGSYDETSKIDFTYADNNIATVKQYVFNTSTSSYVLNVAYTYDEYDNNRSPLSIGYDAFVFNSPTLYSSNNPTKYSITSPPTPALTYAATYTYNPESRPLTGVATIQPANSMVTSTYYYQ